MQHGQSPITRSAHRPRCRSRSLPTCSGLLSGPEQRALAATMPKRRRSDAPVPAQRRQSDMPLVLYMHMHMHMPCAYTCHVGRDAARDLRPVAAQAHLARPHACRSLPPPAVAGPQDAVGVPARPNGITFSCAGSPSWPTRADISGSGLLMHTQKGPRSR